MSQIEAERLPPIDRFSRYRELSAEAMQKASATSNHLLRAELISVAVEWEKLANEVAHRYLDRH
ncbi:MAG TPA: hypothetical protein VKB67_05860 [Rhizomicrobium sp.]|nr:hypothetical protein [Rhizomicrobium sp.]